jgi:membrane fusion protein (multidrug efflux system)
MTRGGLLILATLFIAACGEKPVEKKGAPPTLITTTLVRQTSLEISERTLGTLTAVKDPMISAEVPGKIIKIAVRTGEPVKKGQMLARIDPSDVELQASADRADVARIETLLAQQQRVVGRQNELLEKNFISRNALDDATAQRDALKNQLASARAKGSLTRDNIGKTMVVAPFDGLIMQQMASTGDYLKIGDPIFRFVSNERLRAYLPFPESAAPRLKIGMAVRLLSPLAPDSPIDAVVEDIRPNIGEGARSIELIARLENPGMLKGGGSVDATVITGRKDNALLVPEQSVVLRPAGKVVYVIAEGKAKQQVVQVASKQQGFIEITSGLNGDETIALDGAGFLSDGAAVNVKEAPKISSNGKGETKLQ